MGKKGEEERISSSTVRVHADACEETKRGEGVEAEKKRRIVKERLREGEKER